MKEVIEADYQITGGYNDNAVKVSWKRKPYGSHPEWVYLKTFTGGYLKYISDGKRSPVVFALADTDAFCYCDEDPCLECAAANGGLQHIFMMRRQVLWSCRWIR